MGGDNSILKIIIKECCRSLSFDDERQQYSFPLCANLSSHWTNIRRQITTIDSNFHINNFNDSLNRLENLNYLYIEQSLNEIADADLIQGEMLRVNVAPRRDVAFTLVKMKNGQYLDTTTGTGISLGDKVTLKISEPIITSEGRELGICTSLTMLMPTIEHIVMGRIMLGTYYRRRIATSLWPLYNLSKTANYGNAAETCTKVLSLALEMGIGIMPLMNIINSTSRHGLR